MMPRWLWLLLGFALLGWWLSPTQPRAVNPGSGVVAPRAPLQEPVRGSPPERIGEFRIVALHSFEVEARVLGREDYRLGTEASLSPMDLALGWGRMSDSSVIERLRIRQGARTYSYRWGGEGPPIPAAEIVRSSANMHLIPVDAEVKAAMQRVAIGQVVRFEGWLIRAEREDGWRWASSTTREDTGAGACELVLVNRLVAR